MIKNIKFYFLTLPKKFKLKFIFLIFLLFVNSLFEFVSIGAILPVAQSMVSENFFFDEYLISFFNQVLNIELKKENLIFAYLFLFLLIFLLKTLFSILFNHFKWAFITQLKSFLSLRLSSGYLSQNFNKIYEKGSSALIRTLETELDKFCGVISDGFLNIFNSVLLIFFISLIIFLIQPLAFVVSTLSFGLVLIVFSLLTKKKIKKLGKERFEFSKRKIKSINDFFRSIKEIKIFNSVPFFLSIFKKQLDILQVAEKKYYFLQQNFKPLLEFIGVVFILVFLIASLQINNNNSNRVFVELAVLGAGAFRIMPAMNSLLSFSSSVRFHLPVIGLIHNELLDTKGTEEKVKNIDFKKNIVFKNVSFKFSNDIGNTLEDISFSINKEDIVCISGSSGAGKTTLINLIVGLIEPQSGSIIIDGDKKNLSEKFILNAAFVSQDIILLEDSIKKNIAFGIDEEKINIKKVEQSLKDAEIYDFIIKKFGSIDYYIKELGFNLSGGQKQRIAMARAYYYSSDIYILDEPTSALDKETQIKIINNLIAKKKTVILITHDKSLQKACNKILEIKDKKIKLID